MKNTLISFIILCVVTVVTGIEHIIFTSYPVSQGSLAIDNTFGYLVGIAFFGTVIAYIIDYRNNLNRRREENKINK